MKEFERYRTLLNSLEVEPRFKTARDLGKELEKAGLGVDIRSIQRILNNFKDEFGLKSQTRSRERGNPLEWAWPKRTGRPSMGNNIDPPTAITYEIAAQLLEPLLPPEVYQMMERDFKRARNVLNKVGARGQRLSKKISVLPRGTGRQSANINQNVLNNIYEALIDGKKLRVTYQSITKNTFAYYTLNPLGIITRFDTLYLVHMLDGHEAEILSDKIMEWPLHRFGKADVLDQKVQTPANFNLQDHAKKASFLMNHPNNQLSNAGDTFELEAIFKASTASYVLERPFSNDQQVTKQKDGRVKITATVANTRELLTQLHDFSTDVEIIGPEILRQYFKDQAKQLHAMYCKK